MDAELLRRQQRWAEYIGIWDTEEEEVPFMFMPRIVEDSCLCEHGPTGIPVLSRFEKLHNAALENPDRRITVGA